MSETTSECPSCRGEGVHRGFGCGPGVGMKPMELNCELCVGTGHIDAGTRENYRLGRAMRSSRIDRRLSLREEAKRLSISPYDLSKAEQGIITHPMIADIFAQAVLTEKGGAA